MSDALTALGDWPVPHAAAAVITRDGVVANHGAVGREFGLASVTKPLAALGVLVAAAEEAVSLDDPADPELLPGATLRHLLAHASGIAADDRRRAYPPAERRVYSNAGFELAASLVRAASDMPFSAYLREAVLEPLSMTSTSVDGSAAYSGRSSVNDIARICFELLAPSGLLDASTYEALRTVQFAGLRGVLPGFGGQPHNEWGLGFEIRDSKSPHWTGGSNSPSTYGHFGQAGTFFWVDPIARVALVALTDRPFGEWSKTAWPALSDAVLQQYA